MPEAAFQTRPRHAAYRKPEEAVLFFGHLLEPGTLQDPQVAANATSGPRAEGALYRWVSGCARVLGAVFRSVRKWRDRSYSRRRLAELDDRLRKDIGLSAVDVWRESQKPFWRS